MLLEYRLNLVFLFAAVILGLVLVSRAWRYRSKPLGAYAFILAVSLAFWFFCSFIMDASIVYDFKITAFKLAPFFLAVAAISWLAFVFRYTNRINLLTRKTFIYLALLPLLTQLVIWTNDFHHLMWTSVSWDNTVFPPVIVEQGYVWYWVNIAYISSLFFIGALLVVINYLRSKGIYKTQARLILIFVGATWISALLHYFNIGVFSALNLTPLAFSVTGAYFAINLSKSQLLDLLPIAHDTVFNTISDGVFVLDGENNIIDLNSTGEMIIDHNKSEMVGHNYNAVFAAFTGIPQIVPGTLGIITTIEAKQRYYEVRVSPIITEHQINGHLMVFHDYTERKNLEAAAEQRIRLEASLSEQEKANAQLELKVNERTEQLAEAVAIAKASSQVKTRFLANMSHELRTPLVAIIGFSQILQEEHLGGLNPKQAEYIGDIVNAGKHLLSLINDILDLSRDEAGKMELDKTRVKIKELLQNSIDIFKDRAQAHHIRLQIQMEAELDTLMITIDERRIKQVMLNLLSNALKFTDEGGTISVQAYQRGNDLFVSVSDTGIGISADDQKKIFNEFYQVSNPDRNSSPGTGLGLTICKNIVEKHGGKIWVESGGIDQGSHFTFTLPFVPALNKPNK